MNFITPFLELTQCPACNIPLCETAIVAISNDLARVDCSNKQCPYQFHIGKNTKRPYTSVATIVLDGSFKDRVYFYSDCQIIMEYNFTLCTFSYIQTEFLSLDDLYSPNKFFQKVNMIRVFS